MERPKTRKHANTADLRTKDVPVHSKWFREAARTVAMPLGCMNVQQQELCKRKSRAKTIVKGGQP